jgi:hypothetical protein
MLSDRLVGQTLLSATPWRKAVQSILKTRYFVTPVRNERCDIAFFNKNPNMLRPVTYSEQKVSRPNHLHSRALTPWPKRTAGGSANTRGTLQSRVRQVPIDQPGR